MQQQAQDDDNAFVIGKRLIEDDLPTILVYDNDQDQEHGPLSLAFPNLIVNWHCGNLATNMTCHKLLSTHDIISIKIGRQKLNIMRYLVTAVYRAA
eukprot:15297750-Ditylum_brightwellii.AAC.1